MTPPVNESVPAQLWTALRGRVVEPERLLDAACERALDHLGIDGAVVALSTAAGRHDVLASAGAGAVEVDEAQFVAGEGPSITAWALAAPVLVADLRSDPATPWPGFLEMAIEAKIAAMFSFPLLASGRRLGTLDLHRRHTGPLTASGFVEAELLAKFSALLVADHHDRMACRFTLGAGHYRGVNRAIDMVANQLNIPVSQAAARLRSHAFRYGLSPRTVAEAVLARHLDLDMSNQ